MRSVRRMAVPAAMALVALAGATLALPLVVPGDGFRWRPAENGLRISRVLENRDLDVRAGARIVTVNTRPWHAAQFLRDPFAPPALGGRAQYVIHDGGIAKRRIVPLRPLAPAAALRGYARGAALLLALAALAVWAARRNRDVLALLLAGAGVAVYSAGNVSPLALAAFGLRHMEAAAACWTAAGALLVSRAVNRGHPVTWVALALSLAAGLWIVSESRWVWWRAALTLTALEVAVAVAALALTAFRARSGRALAAARDGAADRP